MKAVSSLIFIVFSSIVRSAFSAERGQCGMWDVGQEKSRTTKGGFDVPTADTFEACQVQCQLFKPCGVLTFTAARKAGTRCQHIPDTNNIEWGDDGRATVLIFAGDTECEIDCSEAFKAWVNWKIKGDYSYKMGLSKIKECADKCLEDKECKGFDACPGQFCRMQKGGDETSSDFSEGCLYYALKRPGCKEKEDNSTGALVKDPKFGSCLQWRVHKNYGGNNGAFQPLLITEDGCKAACVAFSDCRGVTWYQDGKDVKCQLHLTPQESINAGDGSKFWEIIRLAECKVDCAEAVRANLSKRIDDGGEDQTDVNSVRDCMHRCIEHFDCRGFEWSEEPAVKYRCKIQRGSKAKLKEAKDVTFYEMGRPDCQDPKKKAAGKRRKKKTSTTATTTTTEEPTTFAAMAVETQKIMRTDPPEETTLLRTTEIATDAYTGTIFEVTDSCADWSRTPDTRYTKGLYQPHLYTEEMCRKSCLAFQECEAFDWAPQDARKCNHHNIGIVSTPLSEKESYYWKLRRLGQCIMDCSYAIRAKENSKLSPPGEQNSFANTYSQCKKACFARETCRGFDWYEHDAKGKKCFLQFESFNNNTRDAPRGTYYEIGRPLCKDPIKTTNPVIAECIDAFVPNERKKLDRIGERYGDANTVPDCKTACLELDECYGFNWDEKRPEKYKCSLQFVLNGNTVDDSDSTYYQLARPGSGCRGSCIDWTMIPDRVAKSGVTQNVNTEAECKLNCIKALPKCESLDWIPGNTSKCIHHFTGESQELQNQKGAVHWKIKGIQCTGICAEWTRVPDVVTSFGVQQTGISTEKMCKIKCISAFPGCQSIDWIPTGDGVCYHHFNGLPSIEKTNQGAVHWEIKGIQCDDTCGNWTKFEDSAAPSGVFEPNITSEEMCRIACMAQYLCRSLDWAPTSEKNCILHYEPDTNGYSYGANHWIFKRSRNCEINGQEIVMTTLLETVETSFVRPTARSTWATRRPDKQNSKTIVIVICAMAGTMLLIGIVVIYRLCRKENKKKKLPETKEEQQKLLDPAKAETDNKKVQRDRSKTSKGVSNRKKASTKRKRPVSSRKRDVPDKNRETSDISITDGDIFSAKRDTAGTNKGISKTNKDKSKRNNWRVSDLMKKFNVKKKRTVDVHHPYRTERKGSVISKPPSYTTAVTIDVPMQHPYGTERKGSDIQPYVTTTRKSLSMQQAHGTELKRSMSMVPPYGTDTKRSVSKHPYGTELKRSVSNVPPYRTETKRSVSRRRPDGTELRRSVSNIPPYETELKRSVSDIPSYETELKRSVSDMTEVKKSVSNIPPYRTETRRSASRHSAQGAELKRSMSNIPPHGTEAKRSISRQRPHGTGMKKSVSRHRSRGAAMRGSVPKPNPHGATVKRLVSMLPTRGAGKKKIGLPSFLQRKGKK